MRCLLPLRTAGWPVWPGPTGGRMLGWRPRQPSGAGKLHHPRISPVLCPVPPFTPAASPASAPFNPAAGPVFALSGVNTRPSARAAGATAKAAAVPGPEAHAPRVALAPPAGPVAAPADPAPLAAPDPAPAADASPGPVSPLRLPPPAAAEDDGEQPICVICHDVTGWFDPNAEPEGKEFW